MSRSLHPKTEHPNPADKNDDSSIRPCIAQPAASRKRESERYDRIGSNGAASEYGWTLRNFGGRTANERDRNMKQLRNLIQHTKTINPSNLTVSSSPHFSARAEAAS
jgi:hypothetical protein